MVLEELNLDNRDITDTSMTAMASTMTSLTSLDVFSSRVSDYGLAFLSTSLTNLTGRYREGGRYTRNEGERERICPFDPPM